jgi:uncharacterized protein with PQ loop repeat
MNWLVRVILYISVFSAVPAVWLGRKLRGLLWYYALAGLCCDAIPFILRRIAGTDSLFLGNVFPVLELTLVGLYFRSIFSNALLRSLIVPGIVVLNAVFIFDTWHHLNNEVNWLGQVFGQIFLLLLCIAALFKIIRQVEHVKIEQSPLFIFSATFLLYVAYSLLLMLFSVQFRHAAVPLQKNIWAVHNVLNILKNLAIAYIFVMPRKAMRP